jgi:hypothetical protein
MQPMCRTVPRLLSRAIPLTLWESERTALAG